MPELYTTEILKKPFVVAHTTSEGTISQDNLFAVSYDEGGVVVNPRASLPLTNTTFFPAVCASFGASNLTIAELTGRGLSMTKNILSMAYEQLEDEPEWGRPSNKRSNLARFFFAAGLYEAALSRQSLDLSSRQRQMLSLASVGRDTAEIADDLGLAFKTVKNNLTEAAQNAGMIGREPLIMGALLSGELAVSHLVSRVDTAPRAATPQ